MLSYQLTSPNMNVKFKKNILTGSKITKTLQLNFWMHVLIMGSTQTWRKAVWNFWWTWKEIQILHMMLEQIITILQHQQFLYIREIWKKCGLRIILMTQSEKNLPDARKTIIMTSLDAISKIASSHEKGMLTW